MTQKPIISPVPARRQGDLDNPLASGRGGRDLEVAVYANQITYSVEGRDARYENQAEIRRPYPLTCQGAERILRKERGNPTIIVSRVEPMRDEWGVK